jgi:hypothetical protein
MRAADDDRLLTLKSAHDFSLSRRVRRDLSIKKGARSGHFLAVRITVVVEALPLTFCPHALAFLLEDREALSIAQVQTKK